MEDSTALSDLQEGRTMTSERQPLLLHSDPSDCERQPPPRPDIRNSPDNGLVDVQSDEIGSEHDNPKDYNPSLHRELEHPTTNLDTLIHLLKGNIGTGILAMPEAFKHAGLYVGLFGTLIMGAICTHCMHMLVNCAHELCLRLKLPSMGFSDVMYYCVDTGPIGLRRYAYLARRFVNTFLFITQIGFCCVYFLFVALNVQEVVKHYFFYLDIKVYLLLMLIPMIPLNLVRSLKYLTPVSLFAAVLTVTGLIFTFCYLLKDLPHTDSVRPAAPWAQLPLFFGTAIYAFEGIGVVLPLENNMRTPEDFGGASGVLNTGMVIVASLYTSVGFFGYLKYGDHVHGSITLDLPQNEILSQMVRVMMALAIFFSYTLQFYVPVNIVAPYIRERFDTERRKHLADVALRVVLVTITFLLAVIIPNLGAIISLVGAVSSSALALIAPPIIEIITFYPCGWGRYNWVLWKDLAILLFGLLGFVFGTYASVEQILNGEVVT